MGIPNTRVPGSYTQIDNSLATSNLYPLPYKILHVGQKTSAGSAPANTPVRATTAAEASALFGPGSMLALMAEASFASNPSGETWFLPLDDNGAGVAAVGSLALGGAATSAGTLNAYIGGQLVQIPITAAQVLSTAATALVAACSAIPSLPVTAAVDGVVNTKVNFTAKNKGELGNTIDIRVNYNGELTAAGVSTTVVSMTGGTTSPTLTAAIAALGDTWFHVLGFPYADATSLTAIETELASRFDTPREIEGHAFACAIGTVGSLGSLGDSRNSPHLTIVAAVKEPMPAFCKAAETAAIAAYWAEQDPALPIQTRAYAYCLPAVQGQRLTRTERGLLLRDGIATTTVDAGGIMRTERLVTTYQTNGAGAPDLSYLDVETLLTLMFIRHDWKNYSANKYAVAKLADDGKRYATTQRIITPTLAKAEVINRARAWEEQGLIESLAASDVTVVRNSTDNNRLDITMSPNIINQLRVLASVIAFRI